MSMSIRLLGLSAIAMLMSACATPATPPAAGACNANAIRPYVGQVATPAVVDAARNAAGAQLVRALKPNDAATMDYRVERINILVDDANKIVRATCG
ncbi:MAG: I78 family peptidase inhibitor [Thermomonas sp.]